MADPFLGEIRLFGGNYAPEGWAFCNGQLLTIKNNDDDDDNAALFSLIGTTYGGDGITNFALPNLACRLPIHQGTLPSGGTYRLGQSGGTETVSLGAVHVASHTHSVNFSGTATTGSPANAMLATTSGPARYLTPGSGAPLTLAPQSIQATGNGAAHDNLMPFMTVSFIIAITGIYPSPH
jgi:microcystin-dependent protein